MTQQQQITRMNIERIKEELSRIDSAKREIEKKIEELRKQELAALMRELGIESAEMLIAAMKLQHPVYTDERTRFPDELRRRIKEELEKGLKSAAQLSREYGPSYPTIMSWKREWGLTRPRRRRADNGCQ
jgi:hypothetical protein